MNKRNLLLFIIFFCCFLTVSCSYNKPDTQVQFSDTNNTVGYKPNIGSENSAAGKIKVDIKTTLSYYTPLSSSVPGFPFVFEVNENTCGAHIDHIKVTVDNGGLLEWDTDGKVKDLGKSVSVSIGKTLYWSPLADGVLAENAFVTAEAIFNENVIGKQYLSITRDEKGNYYAMTGDAEKSGLIKYD